MLLFRGSQMVWEGIGWSWIPKGWYGHIIKAHHFSQWYISSQAPWCLWKAQEDLLNYHSLGATVFGKMNSRSFIIQFTYKVTLCERGLHRECQSCSGKGRNFIWLLWELVLDRFFWLKGAANEYVILFSLTSDSFFNPDSHYFLTASCSLFFSLKINKNKNRKKIQPRLQNKPKNRNQMKHCLPLC